MILSFKRLQNWLRICNLKLEYSHSSGHSGYDDMKKVLEDIQPDMIFPIHTEKPEVFKEFTKEKSFFHNLDNLIILNHNNLKIFYQEI